MAAGTGRIAALDGLRGVAAAVVVVFHYLCLLHWQAIPLFHEAPPRLADTPLGILWNGPFAVSVFFVLSGFVMAAASERRRDMIVANAVTRYLRLALPVTASVLMAWAWLVAFPDATTQLQAVQEPPSPWLSFTYQGDGIYGPHFALADGLLGNFLRGSSYFNNVLWTMQIELLGSFLLFALYWMADGRRRLWLLAAVGLAILVLVRDAYLAFVTGAALYEASRRGLLDRVPIWTGALALLLGVVLGAPGPGVDLRLGLPAWPGPLRLGQAEGLWAVLAATLILYATLTLRPLARLLALRLPQWLGRISFGLYLVHVPPLYTLVAALHLSGAVPGPLLAAGYFAAMLALAHLFTLLVDEPTIRALRQVLRRMAGYSRPGKAQRGAG